jgi:hypothetical protein
MNAVIEEMAEMESRLLAQQQQLETQQRNLASIIPESDSSSRKARTNGAKNGGANGASANGKNGANGSAEAEMRDADLVDK